MLEPAVQQRRRGDSQQPGLRLMTNVVGCDPDDVVCDMAVKVTWEDLDDGRALPLFEPA